MWRGAGLCVQMTVRQGRTRGAPPYRGCGLGWLGEGVRMVGPEVEAKPTETREGRGGERAGEEQEGR